MKKETPLYLEIYCDLKNKILYGTYRDGDRFPAFQTLCEYYHVSLAPIRAAVKKLAEEGYVRTAERGNSIVIGPLAGRPDGKWAKADVLLLENCYATLNEISLPILEHCARFCGEREWRALEDELALMEKNVADVMKYWLANERFWKILIKRGDNHYFYYAFDSLRCVMESFFLVSRQVRIRDLEMRRKLVSDLRAGAPLWMDDLNAVFRAHLLQLEVQIDPADSSARYFQENREVPFDQSQPMYTSILTGLLQEIEAGVYKKGDFLPSAAELCEQYQVSTITVARVAQLLKSLGFVQSRRGKGGGMQLLVGAEEVRGHAICAGERQKRIRRFLDCLEYLSLTVENVARHAGGCAAFTDTYELYREISLWDQGCMSKVPVLGLLFEYIVSHIRIPGLRQIYHALREEYVSNDLLYLPRSDDEEKRSRLHRRCFEAAEALAHADVDLFASRCGDVFTYLYQWAVGNCRENGLLPAKSRNWVPEGNGI